MDIKVENCFEYKLLYTCRDIVQAQRAHNIDATSIQRLDVEATLNRRCVPAGRSLGRANVHYM